MTWYASSRPGSAHCAAVRPSGRGWVVARDRDHGGEPARVFITSAGSLPRARPLRMPTVAAPRYFPGCSSRCWAGDIARFGARWAKWFSWSTQPACIWTGIGTSGRGSRPRCAAPRCTSSTIRTPIVRFMPRSARPTSTTSRPPKQMPIEPGATYVFDLGYYDYGWWSELDEAGAALSRGSRPTRRSQWRESRAIRDGNILSDRIGFLPAPSGQKPRKIRCRMRCARSRW